MASFDVRLLEPSLRSERRVIAHWMTVYVWLVLRVTTVPISLSPPSIPLISHRMVNYHDPIVIAQDYCAFTFVAKHASSWG